MNEGALPPLVLAIGQPSIVRNMALDSEDIKVGCSICRFHCHTPCSTSARTPAGPVCVSSQHVRAPPPCAEQTFCKRLEVTRDRIPNWPGVRQLCGCLVSKDAPLLTGKPLPLCTRRGASSWGVVASRRKQFVGGGNCHQPAAALAASPQTSWRCGRSTAASSTTSWCALRLG